MSAQFPAPRTPPRCRTRGGRRSWPRPASAGTSPTTWSRSAGRQDRGWHDAAVRALRPAHARPGHDGAALRAGDLRGAEGLPPARRLDRLVPARGQRGPVPRLGAPAGHGRSCPTSCSSPRSRELLAVDREWVPAAGGEESLYLRPFMMATEVGLGVRPSAEYLYCADRLPGRRRTSRAASSPSTSGWSRTTRARRSAAPAPPSAAATTPPRCCPRPRAPSTAARRWSTSTPRSTAGSTRWARTTCSSSTAPATTSRW